MNPNRNHMGSFPSPPPSTSQPAAAWNSWSYPGQSARSPSGPYELAWQ